MNKPTIYMSNPTELVMLENAEHTERYEFSSTAVYRSNIDRTVIGYKPTVKRTSKGQFGSTCGWDYPSKEKGNELFKTLLSKGFIKVTERAFA